jgi:hypothetical protein
MAASKRRLLLPRTSERTNMENAENPRSEWEVLIEIWVSRRFSKTFVVISDYTHYCAVNPPPPACLFGSML